MLDVGSAARIAEIYQLGDDPVLTGPAARGEVGQVWRLTTSLGAFAVKEPFEQPSVAEADDDAAFQDAVRATGVLMPAVVRTRSGDVVAEVGRAHVRVYDWVDLGERDARLDPATVGRLVASIHRVTYIGRNPVDPWYTGPIGADRWDDLVRQLALRMRRSQPNWPNDATRSWRWRTCWNTHPTSRPAIAICSQTTSCALLPARCA